MAGSFGRVLTKGVDTPEQALKQAAESTGQQGIWETIKDSFKNEAINNVITSSVTKGIDKAFGDKTPVYEDELRRLYPNAPEEFYKVGKEGLTKLQAALVYSQYETGDTVERSLQSRDAGTLARFGYGLAGGLGNPVNVLSGMVGGAVLGSAAKAPLLGSGVQKVLAPFYDETISHTVGQIFKRELAENVLGMGLVETPAAVYSGGFKGKISEGNYSLAKSDPMQMAMGVATGTLFGTGVSKLLEMYKFRNAMGKKITDQSIPSHLHDNVLTETLTKEFADFQNALGAYTPYDALKAGAYNRAKLINTVSDVPRPEGVFFGIKEKITGIDTSFEPKYGRTGVFVNDPLIAEGIAQTAGANFDLNAIDLKGAKLISLDTTFSDVNPKTFDMISKLIPEGKYFSMEDYSTKTNKSLQDLFNDLKGVLSDSEENKFFAEVQDKLFQKGYTGFTYVGGKGLQADVAHTVVQMFDHLDQNFIDDASSYVKDLNYENKKMLLEYSPTKKTSLTNEGYLTNGKTITLNEGYFESVADNPVEAGMDELEALKWLFSKEQIDDIGKKVQQHDFKAISRNYKDLVGKKDLLLQVEDWKQFDAAMYGDIAKETKMREDAFKKIVELDNAENPAQFTNIFGDEKTNAIWEQLKLTKEIDDQIEQLKLTDDINEQMKLTHQIYQDVQKELTKDIYKQLQVTQQIEGDLQKELSKDIFNQLELTREVDDQLESLFAKSMEEANLKTPDKMAEAVKAAIVCLRK